MSVKYDDWSVIEDSFIPEKINHSETIFTIGNGYLGTRGTFEENAPSEMRSTYLHGVFDDVPVFFTELANAPDWTELDIFLAKERFTLSTGNILEYTRWLDLQTATLYRDVRWRSPKGRITHLVFERFASLADIHVCGLRVSITPENYKGLVEIRSGIDGQIDNVGFKHWSWKNQAISKNTAWLLLNTRSSQINLASGITLTMQTQTRKAALSQWNMRNHPGLVTRMSVSQGETAVTQKWTSYYTSRDSKKPLASCQKSIRALEPLGWEDVHKAHCAAWKNEWEKCDVIIEGDKEAQLAIRFNIFQLLVAAPRTDERVNIGAKTLSGIGYRGHAFWDTEIFMLPFFSYTRPEIAHNLLSYRWHNLPGARKKASENGFKGAQFPWESAATGEEVTPTWVPDSKDRTKLIRIWTGDIEIHISADITFAVWQYWKTSKDDEFLIHRGAELILETARFWASRVEWHPELSRYEINDIIGPDEYHDHVDNNVYTNAMASWNLSIALEIIDWMSAKQPTEWNKLRRTIKFNKREAEKWQHVIEHIYLPFDPNTRLIEQFEGYFERRDVDLQNLEPRTESAQAILGIEGVCETQLIKQPDVLMLMYLFPDLYDEATVRANFAYYTARTDHTFGSSLGPSIQAIMASRMKDPVVAYEHFMRSARADLIDVRNNAGDGIHGASAGGLWQAIVFGFAGLHLSKTTGKWQTNPALPENWTRVSFKIVQNGETLKFDIHR